MSMKERYRQAFAEKQAAAPKPARKRRKPTDERGYPIASREEQHARYIDCGPAAWDDRGGEE